MKKSAMLLYSLMLICGNYLYAQKKIIDPILKNSFQALNIVKDSYKTMLGKADVSSIKNIAASFQGNKYMDGQSISFNKPNVSLPASQTFYIDFVNNRLINETQDRYLGGYLFHFRTVYNDSVAFSFEVPKIRFSALNELTLAGKNQQKLQLLRLMPLYILKTIIDNPFSLRYREVTSINQKKYWQLSYSYGSGLTIDLYIDTLTKLLYQYAVVGSNPIHGDLITYYQFDNYKEISGFLFPTHRVTKTNNNLLRDEQVEVVINQAFAHPDYWNKPIGYIKPEAVATDFKKVGNKIYMLENVQGYNVFCLEFKDHIMILEAVGASDLVIAKVKKKFPNKPIKYVAISHYHEDHSMGLREYVNEGATIIAGSDNTNYIKYLSANTHILYPDVLTSLPKINTIEIRDKKIFEEDDLKLELINLGPNEHADQIFAYYFPNEKILFQADMLISTDQGGVAQPIIPINKTLYKKIKDLNLNVDQIYGVHLKPIKFKIFEEAIKNQIN